MEIETDSYFYKMLYFIWSLSPGWLSTSSEHEYREEEMIATYDSLIVGVYAFYL